MCKRAFINGPQGEEICPDCTTKLQSLYPVVRNFLRDHEKEAFTAHDVSRILGIPVQKVEALVSAGMIDTIHLQSGERDSSASKRTSKLAPLAPGEAETVLRRNESSMHTYTKRLAEDDADDRHRGEKRRK
jgi:hypothetical protein